MGSETGGPTRAPRRGKRPCAPFPHLQPATCDQEEERWGGASNDEDDPKEKMLPEDPETCLQLNMVYQEVIQEKLAEVSLLLAQNREQQVGEGPVPRTPMARPPGTGSLLHLSLIHISEPTRLILLSRMPSSA